MQADMREVEVKKLGQEGRTRSQGQKIREDPEFCQQRKEGESEGKSGQVSPFLDSTDQHILGAG